MLMPSLFRLTLNTGPRQRVPEQVSMVSTYLMTLRLVMTRVRPSWMMPRSITTDLRGIPHTEVNQGLSRHILTDSMTQYSDLSSNAQYLSLSAVMTAVWLTITQSGKGSSNIDPALGTALGCWLVELTRKMSRLKMIRIMRIVKGKQMIYWQIQYRDDMAQITGHWHNSQLTNSSHTRSGLSKMCLKTKIKDIYRGVFDWAHSWCKTLIR